jgi:hypothetical protein
VCSSLLASIVLMRFTAWKENEYFWTLAGGYPFWLRDIIDFFYYPYYLGLFIVLIVTTSSMSKRFYKKRKISHAFLILCLTWMCFLGCSFLLFANNFLNLMHDRPLHYHQPIQQPYQVPGVKP